MHNLNDDYSINPEDADMVRCLVCMNVDEDSELSNGDRGFGACYKTITGSFFNEDFSAINNDKPEWVFLGELKAVNKGTAVKATGDNGWQETGNWNKNSKTFKEKCVPGAPVALAGDTYYLQSYHDTMFDSDLDFIGLVSSEDGFSNTGLKNGENHLRCWFKAEEAGLFPNTENYDIDWTPDFEADDGQSLAGWASTGVPQIIHLKDSHK